MLKTYMLVLASVLLCALGAQAAEPDAAEISTSPNANLVNAIKDYKSSPDDQTWNAVLADLKALNIESAIPELGASVAVRVINAGQATIWTSSYGKAVLVQWHQVNAGKVTHLKHHRVIRSAPVVVRRSQILNLPVNVVVKAAKTIETPERYLILTGIDNSASFAWLQAYKLGQQWVENNDVLSAIPPFLLKNLHGRVSFSGRDLILTIYSQDKTDLAASNTGMEPLMYKLVLHLLGGKYQLEGKSTAESPYNAVVQFVQAFKQSRMDLAKAWLIDPNLISIPKYIGLASKSNTRACRILSISGAPSGVYRYRLVTFANDDLVFDIIKTKTQWAIKAIYIAPADIVWQRIAHHMMDSSETQGDSIAMPSSP